MKHQEKTPVRLREKKLKDGTRSLYLDIYKDGARRYVYLKMYLSPAKTAAARQQNKETLAAAELERARYLREFLERGGVVPRKQSNVLLTEWLNTQLRERLQAGGTSRAASIRSLIGHIENYDGGVRLQDVDAAYLRGFIRHLTKANNMRSTVHESSMQLGTQRLYYDVLRTAVQTAHARGLISTNPFAQLTATDLKQIRQTTRAHSIEYLTKDELRTLEATPHKSGGYGDTVRRAFLFACNTGLRVSDVRALTWANFVERDGQTWVRLRMKKTKDFVSFPLLPAAAAYLPEHTPANANAPLFKLPTSTSIGLHLHAWAQAAGIQKNLHFHVARHTFATLSLSAGVDIYTIAKFLGHADISSTQIYADVLGKDMLAASNKIAEALK